MRLCYANADQAVISFLNTLQAESSWLPGNFGIRPQTIHILRKAGLSGVLLTNLYSQHGRWLKMGDQRYLRHDDNGEFVSFGKFRKASCPRADYVCSELCYQYRCGWDTGVSFTHLIRSRRQTTYFCINYPLSAFERFQAVLKKHPHLAHRDFFLDALVADECLKQWQFEIGHRRDVLLRLVYGHIRHRLLTHLLTIAYRRNNTKTSTSISMAQRSNFTNFRGTGLPCARTAQTSTFN